MSICLFDCWKYRAGILNFRSMSSRSMWRISSIFSSTGTFESFFTWGTDQFVTTAFSGGNTIGSFRCAAFAIFTVSSTRAFTSAFTPEFVAPNPIPPFASTRTPIPASSPKYRASRTEFFRMKSSFVWCSYRASAYEAPFCRA